MNRLILLLLVSLLQVTAGVAATYRIDVTVTPQGSGTLNTSGGTYEEGASVNLRTSNNTGYVFKGWYEGESLISSATSFKYTMPQHDVSLQAKYEFDPSVPGNPAMPDTTTYYRLTATVSPLGAGTLNLYEGKYAYNANVSLRANTNTGYKFIGWQDEEGVMVSTAASFSYAMPRHDSHLTALYEFDPSVPANPDSMATNYDVYVRCKPVGAGSFNNNTFTAAEGSSVRIYAYTNTGYRFAHWEDENGKVIAESQNFYYVIPHGVSTVYGVFEFDPDVPGNPSKNYWNKQLGELIIDDFTEGSLNSAASSAISGSSTGDVTMITVSGRMNNNDFGIANNYKNCTLLDLSRVTGVTEVPSYAFDGTSLESVYLPATIEKIGDRAFENCKQLASLTLYAMTPPTLGSNVFRGIPEGLVVYVPAGSMAQYQEAAGWSEFTLLPIQEDIRSISVALPEGYTAADFIGMWLELTNAKNGQRLHYVMTDRQQYTFPNIIRNTTWNVQLRNERGDVFGHINGVEVKDDDVSVTFGTLSRPQTVTLSVLAPDGSDLTNQTQIVWLDADGNYLAQSVSMSGLCAGKTLIYRVSLPQDLAMVYVMPTQAEYTVAETSNDVVCTLEAITQVELSGKVVDVSTRSPLSGAVVSASQTFAGKYSKTVSAKTDAQGYYNLTVLNVPTTLSVASSDYISQTIPCDTLMVGGSEVKMPEVALKPITGATISINFTYRPSVAEGEEADVQEWYSDYNNVTYTIYNKTKGSAISQFNVQYPRIVLMEEVDENDELELTAASVTSAFVPVKASATIDAEQRGTVTFGIVGLGGIKAQFRKTDNATVVGSLYDSNGKLVKSYDYVNAALTVGNLADGDYTLVSMGASTFFNNVYDLAGLPQTGLAEGKDYVQHAVKVKSGTVSVVDIDEVPMFDESQFYYTGDNTSFTVNKPSIVAGNYLTLTARIDFKQAYSASVSNLNLIVDLPESCQFVENSAMVGNSTSSYTLDGNRLTIPVARYTDRVRFCVIPTLGGEYAPSAMATFMLDGKEVTQPIGYAPYTVNDLSISLPGVANTTDIVVSGTALKNSNVSVYDNNVLIAQTKTLANGAWRVSAKLSDDKYLGKHDIFAIAETQSLRLQSEHKSCIYNPYAIRTSKVTMINTAHPAGNLNLCEYVSEFDFINPKTIDAYWYWPSYPDFTFKIQFTNNDPTLVNDVVLRVKCSSGPDKLIKAQYNPRAVCWVASHRFNSFALPMNVGVMYNTLNLEELDSLTVANEFVNNFKSYTLEDCNISDGIYQYSVCPTDKEAVSVRCTYFQKSVSEKGFVKDWLKNEGLEPEQTIGQYIYCISGDNSQYAIVKECVDSIYLFRISNVQQDNSKVMKKVFSVDYGAEEISKSTDPLNRWKDRVLKRAIDEANRKLKCANEEDNTKIHDCIKRLRQGLGFSIGSFLAHTYNLGSSAGWGGKPGNIIDGANTLRDAADAANSFGDGIDGLERNAKDALRTLHEIPECEPSPRDKDDDSNNDDVPHVMDPSGYVYEAVSTNRLAGVTATAYYKETVEDMYGDLHDNIVKWDAEEYAQENPLFTDEYGMYQWDVPQGLWQVKFEKEGYETTYSEWLPVPPPQLEVNIPMKQNIQPNVIAAHAYEDAVELEFDKYMMPDLLTAENIIVQADGNTVEGSVQLLNEEVSYEGKSDTYASKVRFNATEPFAAGEVSLRVSNRVKSYAGVRMQDDYMQTFTVEKEISKIVCDSAMNVIYGDTVVIPIAVMPAVASAGKTLSVRTSSSMILSLENSQSLIDDAGMAYIAVVGELPGTSALTYTVEDSKLTATTIVNVVKEDDIVVATPKASIASGTVVEKGTKLYLTCETEGATIYYTTDGTCPCELDRATVYDGPIVIDETVTIKAMAMKQGMYDSEVAEFAYTVNGDDGIETISIDSDITIYPVPVRDKLNISAGGKIITGVTVVTLNGATAISVAKSSSEIQIDAHALSPGIYIVTVTTDDKVYNRKVLKVE